MFEPGSPSDAPPPAYELPRETYDFKTSEALRRSATILQRTAGASGSADEEVWEDWDEEAYQNAAKALRDAEDSENLAVGGASSSSSSRPPPPPNSAPHPSTSDGKMKMNDDAYGYQPAVAIQPLSIHKRSGSTDKRRMLPTPPRLDTAPMIANYPIAHPRPGTRSRSSSVTESPTGSTFSPNPLNTIIAPPEQRPEDHVFHAPPPAFSDIDEESSKTPQPVERSLTRAPTYYPRANPPIRNDVTTTATTTTTTPTPPAARPFHPRGARSPTSPASLPTQPQFNLPAARPRSFQPSGSDFNNRGPVVQFNPNDIYRTGSGPVGAAAPVKDPAVASSRASAFYSSSVASLVGPRTQTIDAARRHSTLPPAAMAPAAPQNQYQLPPGAQGPVNPVFYAPTTPQPQYGQPMQQPPPQFNQYNQPRYSQPQYNQPQYNQPQYIPQQQYVPPNNFGNGGYATPPPGAQYSYQPPVPSTSPAPGWLPGNYYQGR